MAVPRNRISSSRKNKRRAHHARKPMCLVACPKCEAKKQPHCICPSCGSYGGREIIAQAATEV